MPDVSIIIPVYNARDCLKKCLKSIYIQKVNEQVIIVDNGSEKNSYSLLEKDYPDIVLMRNTENKGTSFARNQGLRAAKGEWILFMDADSYIGEGFLSKLREILSSLPSNIGSISPKILKDNDIIFSCGLFLSSIYRSYNIGIGKKSDSYKSRLEILGPNTCCGIYRRQALEQIAKEGKTFDEEFFFLWEDFDIALRLKQAGFKSLFIPELICFHEGGSASFSRAYRRYLHFSGRLKLVSKNFQGKSRFFFFLHSFIYDFLRSVHFFIFNPYRCKAFADILNIVKKCER